MVIRYAPAGRSDLLACLSLVDAAMALPRPLILGAWMTRVWLLLRGAKRMPRATNDVDLDVGSQVGYSGAAHEALAALDYRQDARGYPFRYSRLTSEGLRIIDLLIDAERQAEYPTALAVLGIDEAANATFEIELEMEGAGRALARVPTLDGAFLLRVLALSEAAAGLKFDDYAADAETLGELLIEEPDALARWNERTGETLRRARSTALPLFETERSPGSLAIGRRALGDRVLAARRASATMRDLFRRPV